MFKCATVGKSCGGLGLESNATKGHMDYWYKLGSIVMV